MNNEVRKPLKVIRLPFKFKMMTTEHLQTMARELNRAIVQGEISGCISSRDFHNFHGATTELERRGYKITISKRSVMKFKKIRAS